MFTAVDVGEPYAEKVTMLFDAIYTSNRTRGRRRSGQQPRKATAMSVVCRIKSCAKFASICGKYLHWCWGLHECRQCVAPLRKKWNYRFKVLRFHLNFDSGTNFDFYGLCTSNYLIVRCQFRQRSPVEKCAGTPRLSRAVELDGEAFALAFKSQAPTKISRQLLHAHTCQSHVQTISRR
jgi:hypothetical protein